MLLCRQIYLCILQHDNDVKIVESERKKVDWCQLVGWNSIENDASKGNSTKKQQQQQHQHQT